MTRRVGHIQALSIAGLLALATGGLGFANAELRASAVPSVTEQTVYRFCSQSNCADGAVPTSRLVIDGAGNLYGTTALGGSHDHGTVFKLVPTNTGWAETVLYSFCAQTSCSDGATPLAGLLMDGAG